MLLRSSTPPVPGIGPAFGVHPPGGYPPLAGPPGVPPSTVDETRDGKFERKLWWLLILLLLFALLLTGSNLLPGPAWGEMPDDRALLHVDHGTVSVTVAGCWSVPLTTCSTRRPSGTTSIVRRTASATPSPLADTCNCCVPTCLTRRR